MVTLVRSAHYMEHFRCLGGDCEDTCCQSWTVPVDEANYRRLTVLAADRPIAAKLLHEGVELTPEGPSFARLRFGESGRCGMLDERGLCQIHGELGPSALPDVCATYPRYCNEVDGVLEQFGTLSCPEVARQCLASEDAFTLQELEFAEPPRKLRNQFATEKPYYKPYLRLRSQFSALLARQDYTLSEKLFALLWSCGKLADIVHVRASQLPIGDFEYALMGLLNDVALANLANNYRSLTLDGSLALSVMSSLLGSADSTWEEHVRQRDNMPAHISGCAETCVTRYCQNYLMTTPYMLHENLFAYARSLLRSATALRILIQRRLAGFDGSAAELDARLVEVVYRFSRRLEHSDLFNQLDKVLEQQGLSSLAHTVGFLAI